MSIYSSAVDDQVRPEPPVPVPIRSRWQQLRQIAMPVVVKVDCQPVLPEQWLQVGLEVDGKAMDERQLMRVKRKQILVLGYNIAERGGHSVQDGLSIRKATRCHEDIPAEGARSSLSSLRIGQRWRTLLTRTGSGLRKRARRRDHHGPWSTQSWYLVLAIRSGYEPPVARSRSRQRLSPADADCLVSGGAWTGAPMTLWNSRRLEVPSEAESLPFFCLVSPL